MAANPADSHAPYYLGNLFYDWQPQRAVDLWEKSVAAGADFPVVYPQPGDAYRQQNAPRGNDPRHPEKKPPQYGGNAHDPRGNSTRCYEEDGLAPRATSRRYRAKPAADSTAMTSWLRTIDLKVFAGKYDDAAALIKSRLFRAWEGGPAPSVGDSWVNAMLGRGQQALAGKQYARLWPNSRQRRPSPTDIAEANAGAAQARRSGNQLLDRSGL